MLGATHPDLSRPDHLLWAATTAMGQLLSGEDLHLTIGAALATLGQAVDADRVYIFENHLDPDSGAPLMSQRHEWCAASAEAQIDNPDLQNISYEQVCIRWYHSLAVGQAVAGLVRDFPPSKRPLLEAQSIRSILALPIQIGSQFWGFIGFDDCRTDRLWTPMEHQVLRATAAALGNAYVRLKVEETLCANQAQYQIAVRAGQVGVWNWDLRTNAIDLDPQLKQMLGYEDAEIRNHIEDWGQHVHPEDRERVMAAVRDHLDGRTPEYQVEHRMLHKDGSLRWFLARGIAVREANGKPCRMLSTDTDITELRQSRERERLAGVVFDAA
ncbi:MAG: PAS domain-containing protein [Chromatiaceae bacterium]|nr:PAS domain-containing protein [Chromatiaceae bacterium]